jgi:hypothetical protein
LTGQKEVDIESTRKMLRAADKGQSKWYTAYGQHIFLDLQVAVLALVLWQ